MLSISELQTNTVGIIGFGAEGQAVARFLLRQGVSAVVFEQKIREAFDAKLIEEYEQHGFTFTFESTCENFDPATVLFRSPGFPRLAPALVAFEKQGGVITSQTKWFFDYCPAQIIGVTGTKGKGTTTTLIAHTFKMAQDRGQEPGSRLGDARVYVTGNIGKDAPLDILPTLTAEDIVLFELSSFQLQDLTRSPHVGVCLMVTTEHLNHHKDLAEYHAAKAAVTAFQSPRDIAIYADDYPASKGIGLLGEGSKYAYSRSQSVTRGVFYRNGEVVVIGMGNDFTFNIQKRILRGDHNIENICAATAVASAFGVSREVVADAVISFAGLEHRLEYVGMFKGVSFYNDSISTIPESAIAAVRSFTEPLVLVLGGSDKGSDFTGLARELASAAHIRGLIVIGATASQIMSALTEAGFSGFIREGAHSMDEVISQVREIARPGDAVVLSPACASYDMFKNYKDRGEQFKEKAQSF